MNIDFESKLMYCIIIKKRVGHFDNINNPLILFYQFLVHIYTIIYAQLVFY